LDLQKASNRSRAALTKGSSSSLLVVFVLAFEVVVLTKDEAVDGTKVEDFRLRKSSRGEKFVFAAALR